MEIRIQCYDIGKLTVIVKSGVVSNMWIQMTDKQNQILLLFIYMSASNYLNMWKH